MAKSRDYRLLLAAALTLGGAYWAATTTNPTYKNVGILTTGVGAGVLLPLIGLL